MEKCVPLVIWQQHRECVHLFIQASVKSQDKMQMFLNHLLCQYMADREMFQCFVALCLSTNKPFYMSNIADTSNTMCKKLNVSTVYNNLVIPSKCDWDNKICHSNLKIFPQQTYKWWKSHRIVNRVGHWVCFVSHCCVWPLLKFGVVYFQFVFMLHVCWLQ